LDLRLLELDIRKAQVEANQSDFWHRLIPRVSLSASLGVRDIFFIDPATSLPYVLPRDAYRVTLSLSLSEILDDSKHVLAELQMKQLQTRFARLKDRQHTARELLREKLLALDEETRITREQIRMSEDILRFRQLLFEQGKLHYDVLIRSKLDLLNAKRSLNRLSLQRFGLQLAPAENLSTDLPEPTYDDTRVFDNVRQ
jgi:outer membrane protein TolC